MTIEINGEAKDVTSRTVADLFVDLAIDPTGRAVTINGTSVKWTEWPHARIAPGDRIEIVRLIAGG